MATLPLTSRLGPTAQDRNISRIRHDPEEKMRYGENEFSVRAK